MGVVCFAQGPLLDVNVLEELYLSDELWTNLDIAGDPTAQSKRTHFLGSHSGHSYKPRPFLKLFFVDIQ